MATNWLAAIGAGEECAGAWITLYLVGHEDCDVEFYRQMSDTVIVTNT